MEKLSKGLFWTGIGYFIIMALVNLESTFHLNATQYVADGEEREAIRIAEVIRDVVSPVFQSAILITLSYITKRFSKEES